MVVWNQLYMVWLASCSRPPCIGLLKPSPVAAAVGMSDAGPLFPLTERSHVCYVAYRLFRGGFWPWPTTGILAKAAGYFRVSTGPTLQHSLQPGAERAKSWQGRSWLSQVAKGSRPSQCKPSSSREGWMKRASPAQKPDLKRDIGRNGKVRPGDQTYLSQSGRPMRWPTKE